MAENGTIAYVDIKPVCDIHKMNGNPDIEAEYDFKTYKGPWAYGCESCWKDNRAYNELGTGKGQKLMLAADHPAASGESDPEGQS